MYNTVRYGTVQYITVPYRTFPYSDKRHQRHKRHHSTTIGQGAPQVYVSLMEDAGSHVVKTGSTTGIFRPDALATAPGKAKHFFPGFTIRFLRDHQFINSAGVQETLTPSDYQGQFHWHDGQGRLTIDASSFPLTTDGSRHPHFSADFAYYSLPLLITRVI